MPSGELANRFGLLGAFIGKYAVPSVLISLALLAPSLIAAFFRIKLEVGLDEGFVPENAPSRREIVVQKAFFGETNRSKEWYMALFGIARSPEGNMLQIVINGPRGNFTYAQICHPLCEINDQIQKLMDIAWLKLLGQVEMQYPVSRVLSYDVNIGKHVFNRTVDSKGELVGAQYIAFYFTSFSRELLREKELELFEQAVEREAARHNAQKDKRVELVAHGSNAVSSEMTRGVLDAGRNKLVGLNLFGLAYLALHSLAGWLCDQVPGRRFLLALLSLCMPALSLLASVGIVSIIGLPVSLVFFTSPLLLLSVLLIANGTFHFTSAWCRLLNESRRKHFTASERLASTFDQIAPSFLCTHLPPLLSFAMLFFLLPAKHYRILAAFLALLHLNSIILQVFLFAPLLALLCHHQSVHFRLENGNLEPPSLDLGTTNAEVKKPPTTGHPPFAKPESNTSKEAIQNPVMNGLGTEKGRRQNAKRCFHCLLSFPLDPLGVFLSSLPGKCLVLAASTLLLWLSLARGVPLAANGMDYRRLLPRDSPALRGFNLMDNIWMDFLQILYIIRRPPNFEDPKQYVKFKEFLSEATSMPQAIAPRAHQSWLFDYHRDQLGSDIFAQLSTAELFADSVNMTKFSAFINGFPYRAWRSGVHFTLNESKLSPSIDQMIVLIAYNGTRGLTGKRGLINQCRTVAKRFPDFLISVFDTDSRTVDIMDTIDPFIWRSVFALVGSAFVVPLLVFRNFCWALLYALCTGSIFINLFGLGHFLGLQFDLLTAPSAIIIGVLSAQLGGHFLDCGHGRSALASGRSASSASVPSAVLRPPGSTVLPRRRFECVALCLSPPGIGFFCPPTMDFREKTKQQMINSTPLNGILKKTDRQYSYENTVLGRYRLEASDGTEECRQRVGFYEDALLTDEDRIGQLNVATLRRKSVRFRDSEGAQREVEGHGEQQQRKEGAAWRAPRPKEWMARTRKWAKSLRNAFSCKSIRLMLIDWLFLAILGIGMAMTSMFMDNIIEYLQTFQLVLMSVSGETGNSFLDYICTYLSWLCYTELLAVGSGIPEMKTILRGVILKDYLTARTLFSKIVGLTFSLGSGIPIGKMGPFVHVAANAANLLSSLAARFDGAYSNECRKSEMLAAACATGVACTFSAPIGGVLFSIEVTTMYFSVRNYWRGFFAAACGATVFRWLRVVAFGTEVTLVAFYQTHFPEDAFEPEELPFFALIGLFCGFIGAGFIFFYRKVVMFLRQNSFAKRNIQNNWLLYPVVVAFLVATFTYPRGYGRFLSGRYKFTRTVLDFFSNCTWSKGLHHSILAPHGCSSELLGTWTNHEGYGPYNVFLVLTLFIVTFLILSALCNTMPIPCGMFMPLFVVGAAFGRLMGEIVSSMFPDGISNGTDQPIFPGIYAVVGAAALTGAVTHSVSVIRATFFSLKSPFSVAMICCEITGQLIYIIPLMIAVIIANAICAYLQPSIYDVMIGIKNLPYLPDIPPSNAEVHQCTAENIMVSKVRYLCRLTPFKELRSLLVEMPKLRSFPVVDDSASMMLLGSISRRTIIELLKTQIGDEARKREAEKRIKKAIETIDRHFREIQQGSVRSVHGEAKSDLDPKDAKGQEIRRRAKSEGGVRAMPAEGTKTIGRRCSASDTNIDKAGDSERKGEDLDACRTVGKKCSSSMHRVFPAAMRWDRNGGEGQSSRFVVEPVFSLPKRRCVSNAVGPMAGATRNRRNAISSSSATEMKEEGTEPRGATNEEGGKENGEQLITQKKTSCPEMIRSNWGTLEHQTPISRNLAEYVRSAKKRLRMVNLRHRENGESVDYDLTDDERREWELAQLGHPLEIEEKLIDPAPFQLVRRTSVYKVHYLFSLLDLERAYVTERGRLVGVVALRDLRIAIQNAQNGHSIRFNLYESDSTTGSDKSLDESLSMDVEKGTASVNVADTETGQRQQGQAVPPADGMRIDDSASVITVADYPISSPLQRIRKDENEKRNWGRSQSIRSRYLSLGDHSEEVGDDGSGNVARAVAYLRRKSVALERTPLPMVEGESTS
uniref:Chloride channel protein n=1 Tax=Globodera rostochiensis TaxID=31243 RepID=A0A914HD77_GLORO